MFNNIKNKRSFTLFSLIWPFFPHYPCLTKPSVSYRHLHDLWPLTYISVDGPRFMCAYWACPRSASTWPSSGSSCPTTSAAGPPLDRTTTSWWVFILLYSPYNPRFLWLLPPLLYCDTCHNIKAVVRFGGISSRTCHNIKSGVRVRGISDNFFFYRPFFVRKYYSIIIGYDKYFVSFSKDTVRLKYT